VGAVIAFLAAILCAFLIRQKDFVAAAAPGVRPDVAAPTPEPA
jgi:hypothetical protein